MNEPETLFFTGPSALGALLGYALHLVMSWKEWAKLSTNKTLGFREFIIGDIPGQIIGLLSVITFYLGLPALGEVQWIKDAVGMNLKPNFLSAVFIAFAAQGLAVKLWNILRKINGDT